MAQQPTTTTVTITPRIVRAGDDQGIDRLSMLDFLRGKDGPWSGTGTERWVRYRGHHVERFTADPLGGAYRLTYKDGQGGTTSDWFKVRTTGIALLRDLDDVLDIVLDRWPLDDEGQQ
jgi:hypothetical protein